MKTTQENILKMANLIESEGLTDSQVGEALAVARYRPVLRHMLSGHFGGYKDGKYKTMSTDMKFIDSLINNLTHRGLVNWDNFSSTE